MLIKESHNKFSYFYKNIGENILKIVSIKKSAYKTIYIESAQSYIFHISEEGRHIKIFAVSLSELHKNG